MGFAVRKTYDLTKGIYIPFKDWKNFIEKNAQYRIKGWDKWFELGLTDDQNIKSYKSLLGRSYFKADSKSESGNEDGIVDDVEWSRALNKMGYRDIYSVVKEAMKEFYKLKPQDSKENLERSVRDAITNVPNKIPKEKLEVYISS